MEDKGYIEATGLSMQAAANANPGYQEATGLSTGNPAGTGTATGPQWQSGREIASNMVSGLKPADGLTNVALQGVKAGLSNASPGSAIANVGVAAMNALDNATMGDKNFGAQSEAIDQAVHGASKALMKSGNPFAMAAGAALEGANFLTKATGQNVQGFDAQINSSGYSSNLGHMESKANRDFLGAIGLGGLDRSKADKQLKKRNEQAMMALKAANVADTTKFEQEARMNSVDNVLRNNETALAGGLTTQMLTE